MLLHQLSRFNMERLDAYFDMLGKRGFIRHPREGGDPVPLSTGFPLSRERQNRIIQRFLRSNFLLATQYGNEI